LKIGLQYSPSEKVNITAEVEKDIAFKPSYKGGLEYKLNSKFMVRAGYRYNPAIYSFGVGYQAGERLLIDISAGNHETLGFIPGFSVHFR
jgi:long-subunit fatty acid transport protein